jgi:hypothetical protein
MQISCSVALKRCKHFELGCEKKTKVLRLSFRRICLFEDKKKCTVRPFCPVSYKTCVTENVMTLKHTDTNFDPLLHSQSGSMHRTKGDLGIRGSQYCRYSCARIIDL